MLFSLGIHQSSLKAIVGALSSDLVGWVGEIHSICIFLLRAVCKILLFVSA